MVERPERAGIVLKRLYAESPIKIWPFAPTILKFLPNTLDSNVSRYIQGKILLIIANLKIIMSFVWPSSLRLPFQCALNLVLGHNLCQKCQTQKKLN